MPRIKVRECLEDDCDGVMKLANVADGMPLWKCRKCDSRDERASQHASGVVSFQRDQPEEQEAYTPFGDDTPDSMSWDEFLTVMSEHLS